MPIGGICSLLGCLEYVWGSYASRRYLLMVYDFPVVQSVRTNIEIWLSHGTSWPLNVTTPFSVSNSDRFFNPIPVYIEFDEALTIPVVAV